MRLKNFHTVVENTPQSLKDKVAEMMDQLDNQNLKTNYMPKFRKKPVVIEAEQFVVYSQSETPVSKTVNGMLFPVYKDERGYHILIPTLEGTMRADNLDWIIRGVSGEMYPCKPDIFEKTYEKAD